MELIENIILQKNVSPNVVVFATSVYTTGYALADFVWPIVYKVSDHGISNNHF